MCRLLRLLGLLFALSVSRLEAQTLELVGTDGTSRALSAADLAALTQVDLQAADGQSTATYRGPTFREVLTLAGAPAGRSLRGPAMGLVALAEAADGYVVAFTVSEIDPQFGNRSAILAVARDGRPLPAEDGPLQIVLPDDEFHARWVRQLVRIRLVQVASGPAAHPHD